MLGGLNNEDSVKKYTEQEAQDLANYWGVFLSVDKSGEVWWSESEPVINGKDKWSNSSAGSNCGEIPIRISSEKIWSCLLFRPAIVSESVAKETVEMHHDKKHYRFMKVQSDTAIVNGYCQQCATVVRWERHLTNDAADTRKGGAE